MREVFVGRRDELRALGALFDDSDAARLAVVEGDAGTGKSTLLDETPRVFGNAWTVVRAAPTAAEQAAAWGTVRLLLSGGLSAEAERRDVPISADLLWAAGLSGKSSPGDATQATYAFANLVTALAERTRLLVVIDDAHCVDPASAGALTFAMRSAGHWLLARRAGSIGSFQHPALDSSATIAVALGPFEEHELALLAKHWSGRNWNAVELARLRELSGGNPLHARELVRTYPDTGALAAARLPTGLVELFGARVAALPTEHLDVVAAAALMRRPNLAELYTAFADRPVDSVEDALAAAEEAALLRVVPNSFEFDHALTRRAIADRLGGVATARIHRRLAESTTDPDARAWHLGLGAVGPDEAVAAELEAAGRRVVALGDPAHATDLFCRSLELTPLAGRAQRIRRGALAGTAAIDAGDWTRGLELLDPVAADVGDRPEAPAARAA